MNPSTPSESKDTGGGAPRARPARRLVLAISGLIALSAVALAVRAAGSNGKAAASQPERDVPVQDGSVIRFSSAFAERAGIKTAEARDQPIAPVVEVPGVVGLDPRKVASVGARIQGRVREVHRFAGDEVKAGDALAVIESAELGRAQAEVLKLRAREEAALADEEREQKLLEAKVTSVRDAQAARATAAALRAERLAAEKAVLALGGALTSPEIGTLNLRSPIDGKVLSSKVTRGQFIDPTHTAFEVADLATVWLELSVFERDLPAVREGDEVEFWAQAQPERKLRGRVARLGEVVDSASQSTGVRVEVDNAGRALRPGQGVRARIIAGSGASTRLAIPSEAIITVDGKPTVFVAKDAQTVEVRPISVGPSGQALTAVLEGLRAGETVIASGVFALKSEIFR